MEFPPRGQQIVDALYAQNKGLATGTDDQQRLLTRLMAEQMAYELGPVWGLKSASPDRPIGSSNLAYNGGDHLIGFRWSDGDGHITQAPGSPLHPPIELDLTGQTFHAVDPVDHLKVSATTPPPRSYPPPADPPPPVNLQPILDQLTHLEALINVLGQELMAQRAMLDHPPTYRTAIWGVQVILHPGPP